MFPAPLPSVRLKLKTLLAATFGALVVVLSLLLSLLIAASALPEVRQQIGGSLAELAFQMQDKLDRGLYERFREIRNTAALKSMMDNDPALQHQWLELLQATYQDYAWIGLTDPRGIVKAATGGLLEGHDVSQRPWFQAGRQGPFAGDVHEALLLANLLPNETDPEYDGEAPRFVDVAAPVMDGERLVGVLGAHLSWEWARRMERSLLAQSEARADVQVLVLRQDGRVLLGPSALLGQVLELDSLDLARRGRVGFVQERWPDDRDYLTGFSPSDGHGSYPGLDWIVLVRQDDDQAFAPATRLGQRILLAGLLLGGIFTLLVWILSQGIAEPLTAIGRAADQIRQGDMKAAIPPSRRYREVSHLSSSLRALVTGLTARQAELHTLNQSLEERVRARTEELQNTVDSLAAEVRERRKVEQEREGLIAELRQLAEHDSLTGALNRRAFFARAGRELNRARRLERPLAAIMLDVDHFKAVNDNHGHAVGDQVLRQVVSCTRATVREIDLIGRYGGEEFALLALEASQAAALGLAERLRREIESLDIDVPGGKLRITASLGIAANQPYDLTVEALLEAADQALYRAKRAGRNRVMVASEIGDDG